MFKAPAGIFFVLLVKFRHAGHRYSHYPFWTMAFIAALLTVGSRFGTCGCADSSPSEFRHPGFHEVRLSVGGGCPPVRSESFIALPLAASDGHFLFAGFTIRDLLWLLFAGLYPLIHQRQRPR